jgi:hypothetical protein
MKIPRLPKTTSEIISQIETIDKRINALLEQKDIIFTNYTTQTNASAHDKEKTTNCIYLYAKPVIPLNSETNNTIFAIDKELQTLYLRKRYLERLIQKSKISSQKEILSKTPKRFKKTSGRLRQNASAFLKKTAAFFKKHHHLFIRQQNQDKTVSVGSARRLH